MKNGAIEVDREMRTSLPDVYAAGDCAGVYNRIAEQNVYSALGTVANKCGRIAGENMLGAHVRFDGCLGSSAISVCGMEAARTGLGEAAAGLALYACAGPGGQRPVAGKSGIFCSGGPLRLRTSGCGKGTET